MSLLEALVLGLVQGITEFLPISSTAHLRIVPALLGWDDPGAAYSAVIQLGTVGAVLVYFARDIQNLSVAFFRGLVRNDPLGTADSRLAWYVGLGTVPIGLLGLLFKKSIETSLRSLWVIAASMIVLGLVLLAVERLAQHTRRIADLTLRDAIIIGCWQALALIPGSSRSGTTLTGGLSLGLMRADAARYSFLLSIPATTLAGLLQLKELLKDGSPGSTSALVLGTVVSFLTGLLAIHGLLRFLRTRSTLVFVAYRVVLGLALLGLLATGVLAP
jgi:undecaprenyl-diphosphatase